MLLNPLSKNIKKTYKHRLKIAKEILKIKLKKRLKVEKSQKFRDSHMSLKYQIWDFLHVFASGLPLMHRMNLIYRALHSSNILDTFHNHIVFKKCVKNFAHIFEVKNLSQITSSYDHLEFFDVVRFKESFWFQMNLILFYTLYASGPGIPPKSSIFGRRRSIFYNAKQR